MIFEGDIFPPKYIISLANRHANGHELEPSKFYGGEETNSVLQSLGFEIQEGPLYLEKEKEKNRPLRNWWVEKSIVKNHPDRQDEKHGLGKALWSPQRDKGNRDIYSNMRRIKEGDIVLHLVDNKEFQGISVVKSEYDSDFYCLPGSSHDDGTGKRLGYFVSLKDFQRFDQPIDRSEILNEKYKEGLLSLLDKRYWVFYNKKLDLNQGSYLTEAPPELVQIINEVYINQNGENLPYWTSPQQFVRRETVNKSIPSSYTIENFINETGFDKEEIENWLQILRRKGQIIFQGPPGTGKTFVALRLARLLISNTFGFQDVVQFHPDYSYEDFIQGYFPESKEHNIHFELRPGRFLEFCARANKVEGAPCVLIIDEINRAHLARVFGELMYLLEYRDEKIPLAAGGKPFCIPQNVYLVGTMNTADRSIALVDHALRRRFSFIRLKPKYEILERYLKKQDLPAESLINVLRAINRAIDDQNYEVGISFFMKDGQKLKKLLPCIWKSEIEPYIEEFFYDQPCKVQSFSWESLIRNQLHDWDK